ncbi:MAG TPA: LacI family DNA-binding transcriptional regulator, partial [Anaerolineales bacterium]|nr:LacI family DNA-binding transcriptional regulator [Anaerolineales bacterium]
MEHRVTLKQVAAHAGVSYQTVSKVLNQQAQVSKETEERIWNSVRSLGYRPNQIARSLRSSRSCLIGYSWEPTPPDQPNSILDLFLMSMTQAAERAGYHLLTFPHRPGEEWIDSYRELIDTNRVDGFVLSSVENDDSRISFLCERNFPFVAFGRSDHTLDYPYVDVDGAWGTQLVVEHLLAMGHQRIFALAWPQPSRVGENRLEGFLKTLGQVGVGPGDGMVARGEGSFRFGYETTVGWLDQPLDRRPTAIVAFNDAMAIGAMQAIRERGLSIGEDIAVSGFDDAPMVQYLNPPLTSVRQPAWEVGQRVISILAGLLDGTPPIEQQVLLQPRLIV